MQERNHPHLSCGSDVGLWFLTDVHLDNYEIRKIGTNFHVLCGQPTVCITFRRRKSVVFQTYEMCNLKSVATTSNPRDE